MSGDESTKGETKAIRVGRAKDEVAIVEGILSHVDRMLREEQYKSRFGLPSTVHRTGILRDIVLEVWQSRHQRLSEVEAEP
jgi:hypothetical protein